MTDYASMAANAQTPSGGGEGPPEFKFTDPGQEVFGQVTKTQFGFRTKFTKADDPTTLGNVIEVTDHRMGPVTVWLTNYQLRVAFVEGNNPLGRPVQVSDVVYIRYDNLEPLEGGNTVKNFSVNLQAGNQVAAAQAQPVQQQAPPPQVPQAPVQQPVPQQPVQQVPTAPVPTQQYPQAPQQAFQQAAPQVSQQQAPPPGNDGVPF